MAFIRRPFFCPSATGLVDFTIKLIFQPLKMVKIFKDHLLICIILYIALGVSLRAQQPTVSKISFVGNEHTKEHIFNREIQHPISVPLDSTILNADRERLENLQIFSMVHWQAYSLTDSTIEVRFFLVETWRYLPGLAPVYDEKTGWSLSGLLIVNNFRGCNQTLQLAGIVGGISSYSLSFFDPWIMGNHISLRTEYRNERFRHYYLPYDQRLLAAEMQIGKDYFYRHKLRGKIRFEQKGFRQADTVIADFNYIQPALTYSYDTRNLYADPYTGGVLSFIITVGFPYAGSAQWYWTLSGTASQFRKITGEKYKLVFGANLRGNFRFGYRHTLLTGYLGGAYTIRGWTPPNREIYADQENVFRFGYQSVVVSLELRQTLIPKFVTVLRNESGLILVTFLDVGIIADDIAELRHQKPLLGIGIGFRIPTPMVGQLRLDYGWGLYDGKNVDHQLHLAFGHSF